MSRELSRATDSIRQEPVPASRPLRVSCVLKVLDKTGRGRVSDVIAALDHVIAVRSSYNIRVVNLSIAAPILESYDLDPLTVAARTGSGGRTRRCGRRRQQG